MSDLIIPDFNGLNGWRVYNEQGYIVGQVTDYQLESSAAYGYVDINGTPVSINGAPTRLYLTIELYQIPVEDPERPATKNESEVVQPKNHRAIKM